MKNEAFNQRMASSFVLSFSYKHVEADLMFACVSCAWWIFASYALQFFQLNAWCFIIFWYFEDSNYSDFHSLFFWIELFEPHLRSRWNCFTESESLICGRKTFIRLHHMILPEMAEGIFRSFSFAWPKHGWWWCFRAFTLRARRIHLRPQMNGWAARWWHSVVFNQSVSQPPGCGSGSQTVRYESFSGTEQIIPPLF